MGLLQRESNQLQLNGLFGMTCRLAYSPADATATHYLLLR